MRDVLPKADELIQSWKSLRPTKTFYGFSLEGFTAAAQRSRAERATLADLRGQAAAARTRCHDADVVLADATQGIINAVKGDPQEGEDGELYVALGYVRKSSRYGSRPRRRVNDEAEQPKEEVKQQNGAA